MANSSNYTDFLSDLDKNDAWKESGAMVYVALTVATLSSVIVCCVWFVKQRIHKGGYGTVDLEEDRVELTGQTDEGAEESSDDEIQYPTTPQDAFEPEDRTGVGVGASGASSGTDVATAFVLEDDSDEDDGGGDGFEHGRQVEAV